MQLTKLLANVDAHLPARPAAVLQRPLLLRAPVARVARDMGDEPRGADFKLYDACAEGRLELVKKWWPLSKHPLHTFKFIVTPSWDEHGQHSFPYFQNVLHAACEGGHLDVVEYLLELHFLAFKQDSLGRTPLKIACEHGQAACAALCLDARGQRRTRRQWTNTIPCGLCRRKHCDCRFPLSEGG